MIPLIFAILFAVIEYAYFFGAVHYVNYATFAAARAQQTSSGNGAVEGNVNGVSELLLHGNVTKDATLTADPTSGTVSSTLPWTPDTPGFKEIMGDMTVSMSMTLGQPECNYEDNAEASSGLVADYQDNRRVCQ
jgi:Flp pilus assembly protein TadG